MLDEGYELEMYIIEGRIHVECYPRDLLESRIVGEKISYNHYIKIRLHTL